MRSRAFQMVSRPRPPLLGLGAAWRVWWPEVGASSAGRLRLRLRLRPAGPRRRPDRVQDSSVFFRCVPCAPPVLFPVSGTARVGAAYPGVTWVPETRSLPRRGARRGLLLFGLDIHAFVAIAAIFIRISTLKKLAKC